MSYYTQEHTITSERGWKRPLFTSKRVYRSLRDVRRRIAWLCREYGEENVIYKPKKGDPSTEEVYIRLF